jgi:hypothetical protein
VASARASLWPTVAAAPAIAPRRAEAGNHPDGWDRFFGLEPYAELEDANQLYRYDAVLVLDPLDTFEDEHDVVWAQDREIRRVHELIVQGYYDSGYSPVFVPADAPEERLEFICANLRLPRPSRED